MRCGYQFCGPPTAVATMMPYNIQQSSSSVSDVSSAPPSPVSCTATAHSTTSTGNVPRYGTLVPNRVFVGGIASNTTELDLQELFAQYGNIKEIKIISDRGGVCKGYGFVTFETVEEAKRVQDEPDSLVLKERRLNIAPAVIKQQPFNRPYDMAQQPGALLYHNGTPYTYQNGMAFFTASGSAPSPYAISAPRDTAMYTAGFAPAQAATPAYSMMYHPTYAPQPMPYLPAGQQYPYQPVAFDPYFKSVAPPTSQYIYAPSAHALNGAMNSGLNGALNSTSQSPSPGYGQPPGPTGPQGPPSGPPTATGTPAYYHAGSELYYNGGSHPTPLTHPQHQPIYSAEHSHSEDWYPETRQAGTPVVSLLKLHEAGSVEELEITRTPKKPIICQPPIYPAGPGGPRTTRSRRPTPQHGRGRGVSVLGSLAGQRSASSPHLPSAPNSCLHRSTSLSPSAQVSPVYGAGRQQQQSQQQYQQRRGFNSARSVGPRNAMGTLRPYMSYSSSPNSAHSASTQNGNQNSTLNMGQNSSHNTSQNPGGNAMNGVSTPAASPPTSPPAGTSPGSASTSGPVDEGGAGDAQVIRHQFPLSPPDTPLPQGISEYVVGGAGGDEGDMHKKMRALAL